MKGGREGGGPSFPQKTGSGRTSIVIQIGNNGAMASRVEVDYQGQL